MSTPSVPSSDDIQRVAEMVRPWVRRTPVIEVVVNGHPVSLKLELLQHAGSFKVRRPLGPCLIAQRHTK